MISLVVEKYYYNVLWDQSTYGQLISWKMLPSMQAQPPSESLAPACYTTGCHCICDALANFKPGCHCGFYHTFSITNYAHFSVDFFPMWLSNCPLSSYHRFPLSVCALLAGRHNLSMVAAVTLTAHTVIIREPAISISLSLPRSLVLVSFYEPSSICVSVRGRDVERARERTQELCALQGQVTLRGCLLRFRNPWHCSPRLENHFLFLTGDLHKKLNVPAWAFKCPPSFTAWSSPFLSHVLPSCPSTHWSTLLSLLGSVFSWAMLPGESPSQMPHWASCPPSSP